MAKGLLLAAGPAFWGKFLMPGTAMKAKAPRF